MTFQEFYDSITNTEHPLQKQTKSLEEFWRSLYPLVEAKRGDKINLDDFHQLLINAITQTPIAIKEAWLSIDEPIDPEDLDEEIREAELDEEETAVKEFNYFLYTLAFQIAELHVAPPLRCGPNTSNDFAVQTKDIERSRYTARKYSHCGGGSL